VQCSVWTVRSRIATLDSPNTVWIGVDDHLPHKYIEGEIDHPITVVTYADFGRNFAIALPATAN